MRPRRALLSVWDKRGLAELGGALAAHGVTLVASGGTAAALADAGLEVETVESVTGAPEILGGRVKTLHPVIHGAILARRDREEDLADLSARSVEPIDLVVVDLYPFQDAEALGAGEEVSRTELIDIGGVALLRAAAKNWRHVVVLSEPGDYDRVIEELAESGGSLSGDTRRSLAAKAFRLTAWYDAGIAAWLSRGERGWPERWTWGGELANELRYGENPHQAAALYREGPARADDLVAVEILQGKELSYNNYLDVEAARRVARDLHALEPGRPHCVIVKHTIPCGAAGADSALEAYQRALAADPVSAFGGIVALDRPVDGELAARLAEHFLEVVYAPAFDEEARETLRGKKNLRLLAGPFPESDPAALEVRRVGGGLLLQRPNLAWLAGGDPRGACEVVTSVRPTEEQWVDLLFAWTVCRQVASNAIVLAKGGATIGVGGGQTNRVGAVELALRYACEIGHDPAGAALASDGFFPFPDAVEAAAGSGIGAIIQPGGSRRDEEVVAAAESARIPMVLTRMRQFRH
ncbi:MAG TPA: bifunctional phosphoribosylaminoimidazolecarboxamide formyltransferase/IMP cyclohydrolase [Gemmatimonadota bacterium]|nr:bifunctional phosphoribosylaminoimidazolecarboxamide formyltransferase/IMP cyclohydrolase [Gemmatimonadota bacterium]